MSTRTLEENIRLLEQATARAKSATKEANHAVKLAKQTIKELQAEHDRWAEGVRKEIDEAINRQIKLGLDDYADTIQKQTSIAHEHVISEFTKMTNIMLHGNEEGKGESVVPMWIKKLVREEVRKIML